MKYNFETCVFDTEKFELRREGTLVEATPQVLAILKLLLVSRDRLVTKDELVDEVWGGRAISDAAITVRMRALRQAVGDTGEEQRLIKTVRGRGFRFVGEVKLEQVTEPVVMSGQADERPASQLDPLLQIPDSKPKIAVLPFELLTPAGELGLLARALPDEILTSLSKLRSLAVIARGSSFQFGSFAVSPGEIRRQLGADYCLSGQMELRGESLSLSLELADTRNNGAIWRNSHTVAIAEVHELRQDIVHYIAHQAEEEITRHELAAARLGVPSNLKAWQLYHKGNEATYFQHKIDLHAALGHYQASVDQDPHFARAHSGKAIVHSAMAHIPWIASNQDHQRLAAQDIERAMMLDPLDPQSYVAIAYDASQRGAAEEARSSYHRAIELSPSGVSAPTLLARMESFQGQSGSSRTMLNRLSLLSPIEAGHDYNFGTQILNHLGEGDSEQAGEIARMLEERRTQTPHTLALVVAGLTHSGADELATQSAMRLREVAPGFTGESFVNSLPVLAPEMADLLRSGLDKPGVF
jgi:DNA-binding winged helix-turn-helix (wHTH) protein